MLNVSAKVTSAAAGRIPGITPAALAALVGLQDVITGERQRYSQDYPCPLPSGEVLLASGELGADGAIALRHVVLRGKGIAAAQSHCSPAGF